MYASAKQTRAFGEIYPRKSMLSLISDDPLVKPYLLSANNSVSWYLCSRTYDDGLNDGMSRYFGNAINSILFKTSVSMDTVISDLRQGVNQLADKNRYNLY